MLCRCCAPRCCVLRLRPYGKVKDIAVDMSDAAHLAVLGNYVHFAGGFDAPKALDISPRGAGHTTSHPKSLLIFAANTLTKAAVKRPTIPDACRQQDDGTARHDIAQARTYHRMPQVW